MWVETRIKQSTFVDLIHYIDTMASADSGFYKLKLCHEVAWTLLQLTTYSTGSCEVSILFLLKGRFIFQRLFIIFLASIEHYFTIHSMFKGNKMQAFP